MARGLKWAGSLAAQREHQEALRKNPPRPKKLSRGVRAAARDKKGPRFRVTRDNYGVYLATPHWKRTARRKREAARFRCQRCGAGGYLEVHHRHYRTLWGESDADLECLCRACHEASHQTDLSNAGHLRSI